MRKIICRDSEYRQHKNINFSDAKEGIFHGLNQCIPFWFHIRIRKPRKYVCQRDNKVPSSDWKLKCWSDLNTFLIRIYI